MAIHEERVAEGDQRQQTDAEGTEDIVPTPCPIRGTKPSRDAKERTSAYEDIGRSKESVSTKFAGPEQLSKMRRPYSASWHARESAARVASPGLRFCCCSTIGYPAFHCTTAPPTVIKVKVDELLEALVHDLRLTQ
jgi:hypothetical protein